jgi:hypothetical protein
MIVGTRPIAPRQRGDHQAAWGNVRRVSSRWEDPGGKPLHPRHADRDLPGSASKRPAARLAQSGPPTDLPCPRTCPDLHRLSETSCQERVVARGRRLGRRGSTGPPPRSRRPGTRTRGAPAPHDRVLRPSGQAASVHPGPAGPRRAFRCPAARASRPRSCTVSRFDRQKSEQQLMSTR